MKLRAILIAVILAGSARAATITAAGAGNWSAGGTWTGGVVPGNGDTADLNGYVVAMDIATIPASGTLLALTGAGKAGQLTVNMAALGNAAINATTITAGTVASSGFILVSGAAPAATLSITGNITAGSGSATSGVYTTSTAALVVNGNVTGGTGSGNYKMGLYSASAASVTVNGNVTGGTANSSYGVYLGSTGVGVITGNVTGGSGITSSGLYIGPSSSCTLNSCNIVNSATSWAFAGSATIIWNNPTNAQYIDIPGQTGGRSDRFVSQIAAEDVRSGVVEGNVTGTMVGGGVKVQ